MLYCPGLSTAPMFLAGCGTKRRPAHEYWVTKKLRISPQMHLRTVAGPVVGLGASSGSYLHPTIGPAPPVSYSLSRRSTADPVD
jgi:hypothetical protein